MASRGVAYPGPHPQCPPAAEIKGSERIKKKVELNFLKLHSSLYLYLCRRESNHT